MMALESKIVGWMPECQRPRTVVATWRTVAVRGTERQPGDRKWLGDLAGGDKGHSRREGDKH